MYNVSIGLLNVFWKRLICRQAGHGPTAYIIPGVGDALLAWAIMRRPLHSRSPHTAHPGHLIFPCDLVLHATGSHPCSCCWSTSLASGSYTVRNMSNLDRELKRGKAEEKFSNSFMCYLVRCIAIWPDCCKWFFFGIILQFPGWDNCRLNGFPDLLCLHQHVRINPVAKGSTFVAC